MARSGRSGGNSDRKRSGRRRRGGRRAPKPRLLKTGELIARSGLSRQVIYTYVTMGLIREADRTPAGHKLFHERTLTHIRLIRNLNEGGYTLRDIKEIFFRDAEGEMRG